MKNSTIFWGTFLVTLGILLLLHSFGLIAGHLTFIYNFWPLVFVIWGLSILKFPQIYKKILTALAALFLALLITGVLTDGWRFSHRFILKLEDKVKHGHEKSIDYYKSISLDSNVKICKLQMSAGAGEFNIGDTTDGLFNVKSSDDYVQYSLKYDSASSTHLLNFDFIGNSKSDNTHIMIDDAKIKLNTGVIWDIKLEIGAAESNLDLSKYRLRNMSLSCGASSIECKLGSKMDTQNVEIEAGASSIELLVPKDAGCVIFSETGLSSKDFVNFNKENDKYITENFYNSSKKIFIHIKGGISNFDVNRY